MANVAATPTNFAPARINQYCPAMRYSADVNYNAGTRVSFGAPSAASTNAIANAISIATAGTGDLSGAMVIVEPYGRNVTYVASGASTASVTLNGYDYLGQPVSETVTLNGVTPVVGKKAFKYFRNVTYTATAGTTMNIGTGAILGLPYKSIRCQYETANQALVTAGTLAAPVLTDPQTATTGDPRGTYIPTTAFDGSTQITAVFDMQNDVNASNRGGLYGIAHFTA
jgi:hypothetical protein